MGITRSPCSQTSVRGSNPPGEASGGEDVSRNKVNPLQPRYASLRVVSPSKMVKPVIGREATGTGTCRALRGGWGRRASKDQPRNLGDPTGWTSCPTDSGKT